MDYVASFFDSRSSSWSYASLRNFNKLSSPVQSHLQKVYLTLAAALLVSALGVYVHILWHIGGLITSLGFIATTAWLVSTPSTPAEEGKRLKLLAAAAFFEGASVGTLVEAVLQFDPSIVVMAFLGSVAVFACFSGAALVARRREYLFLGGILSSVVSLMLLLQFSSLIFGRSAFMYNVEIFGGLLVFMGYVLFDTQMIIERANRGDYNYVKHALDLFVDFAAIFVRLLVIMTKNSSQREQRDQQRRKRRSY
ncbi:hypothetical protein BDL97_06G114400 [Sphagnum fallax]|nr:hypothetical protein BDL97_06G114400 [Sphagnum fallax]